MLGRLLFITAALLAATPCFAAEAYPSKPIRWIIPFPPGGGTIGLAAAAKLPPDGYNLVLGQLANVAIEPALYAKLPYDPVKDFTELVRIMKLPEVQRRFEGESDLSPNSPEEFGSFIRNEISKWAKAVKESGAKVD